MIHWEVEKKKAGKALGKTREIFSLSSEHPHQPRVNSTLFFPVVKLCYQQCSWNGIGVNTNCARFAIHSQLFWDLLNWPSNICTGCVLECFGWWNFRKSGLNSIFFLDLSYCAALIWFTQVVHWHDPALPPLFGGGTKRVLLFLPLLWLTSCWPSVGRTDAAPDWLGSKNGTSECQGNTGTDRGSTLVHTMGTWEWERRERKRKEWDTIQSVHLSVTDCKQKVALCPLAGGAPKPVWSIGSCELQRYLGKKKTIWWKLRRR